MRPRRYPNGRGAPGALPAQRAPAARAAIALALVAPLLLAVFAAAGPVAAGAVAPLAAVPLQLAPAATAIDEPDFTASPIYRWLRENRSAAYWAAPLLMIVVAILPIPAEIPAAINGMLFGTAIGFVMTWCGALVGAQISYELSRYFGRRLSRRFVRREAMAKLEALRETQAPVLLMLRLTPIVAFTVVNWAAGLLQVRRSTFLWTTAVGILPGAIAFTASGSVLGWLYEMHPAAVTAIVVLLGGTFVARAWWKRRVAASNAAA